MTSLELASLLSEPVGIAHYLVVGAVLFVCGALCMATKRNAIGVLMGIELVLNGANLNFIAFGSRYLRNDPGSIGLDSQLMSLFVIVLAAPEQRHQLALQADADRKSTRLKSSHPSISYAVFFFKKKKTT